jgi:uncharacterized protein YfiM (DUF2279 family)
MSELLLAVLLTALPLQGRPEPVPPPSDVRPTSGPLPDIIWPGSPPADRWLGSDKFQHALLSFAATSFTFAALRSLGMDNRAALPTAMMAAGGAGVGKELHDRRGGGAFSGRDLVADGIGIMTAFFLLREVR